MGCCIFMFLLVFCIFEVLYSVGKNVLEVFACLKLFLFMDNVEVSR